MNDEKNLISIGEVINTQANKGEVRVWPLTDFPERFKENEVLLLERDGQTRHVTIEKARLQKNYIIIKFKEILDMNEAEQIKGGILKIPKDELMKLPADTYYIFELVGMEVRTVDGEYLGKIAEVFQTGSNDIYVVAGKLKKYMIPAIKEIVKSIDKENRQITIKPLEGLLDL